jgi:cell division protein FtsQ
MRHLMAELRAPAARAGRRRPPRRVPHARWRVAAISALALGLVVTGGAATTSWWRPAAEAGLEGLAGAVGRASVAAGLGVREVYVSGRGETGREELLVAIDVAIGDPLLFVDLGARRDRVRALPWVGDVVIERRLPDVLVVHVTERRPMALWQFEGEVRVIDRQGEVIAGVDPRRFAELPLLVGPDAPVHAAELLAVLAGAPRYVERISAAIRVGGRRWDLRFENGVTLALPAEDAARAWARFTAIDGRERLLQREVETIDLRLPDRMFLRLTPAGREALGSDDGGAGEST